MAAQSTEHTRRHEWDSGANDAIFFIFTDLLWMPKYWSMLVKLIQKVSAQFTVQMEKMRRAQVLILSLLWWSPLLDLVHRISGAWN